jgi:carbonic anhydrase
VAPAVADVVVSMDKRLAALSRLLDNNRRWAADITARDPQFFRTLSRQQAPKYLWIGCADSRVPANDIVGLLPGELFVHRNVANVVTHTDLNCLSVIQYAIDVLKVEHIIVCGHYGCGGVQAAMTNTEHGLIDNWLRTIKDVYQRHREQLEAITDETKRVNLLCELNVSQQAANVCHTTIVQNAWRRGHHVSVHGVIYSLDNGILRDLGVRIATASQIEPIYRVGG